MYDFQCPKCGQRVESLQGFNDPPPFCATCNLGYVRTVPTKAPGAKFVGGGWSNDLYCSVTPTYKDLQQRIKNAQSGRYRPDGKTPKSPLRSGNS